MICRLLAAAFLLCSLPAYGAKSSLYQFKGDYEGRVIVVTRELPDGQNVRRALAVSSAEFKAAPGIVQGGLELIVGGLREHLSFRGSAFQYKRSTIGGSVTIDGAVKVRPFSMGFSGYDPAAIPGANYPRVAGFIEYLGAPFGRNIKVVVAYYSATRNETRTYFLSPARK